MEWIIGTGSSIVASVLILLAARASGLASVTLGRRSQQRRLATRLINAGLTNLFITRADYAKYRGISTLMGYLATADRAILVVGYWMAQGAEIENFNNLGKMLLTKPELQVHIAIIHPEGPHVEGLAEHLGEEAPIISIKCRNTLQKLVSVRDDLPAEARQRFLIRTYTSTPVASIIVLDGAATNGRVQVDLKPYRNARNDSVGFEASGSEKALFEIWRKAAELRFEKAQDWAP